MNDSAKFEKIGMEPAKVSTISCEGQVLRGGVSASLPSTIFSPVLSLVSQYRGVRTKHTILRTLVGERNESLRIRQ